MHFRCRVWQAQILDVIHHVLLLQYHRDLYEYEVTWHKKCYPLKSSVVFFLLFNASVVQNSVKVCCIGQFEPLLEGSFHLVLLMDTHVSVPGQ